MPADEPKGAPRPAQPAGNAGGPNGGPERSGDPTAFILDRTRSEVHLLLDNISANPEVTISSLANRLPRPKDLPEGWIEQVCEITWPPKDHNPKPDKLAKDAALLILARDYLNGLAKPASGATIAFTLLVSQEQSPSRRRRRADGTQPSPSRGSLACDAYPDLVDRARTFRDMMSRVVACAVVALITTLIISWYLAIGNAALADLSTARARLTEADAKVAEAQTALLSNNGPGQSDPNSRQGAQGATGQAAVQAEVRRRAPAAAPGGPAPPSNAAGSPASSTAARSSLLTTDNFFLEPCTRLDRNGSLPSAQLRDACATLRDQREIRAGITVGLQRWAWWAFGARPESAAWVANLLGTAVLPVLYGFLGAIASVVRTWSRKIKASRLSPRDLQLSLQQLALGALVGACISLFIAAPAAGNADAALLGPVALSSSAISFVAGFGVDSVFQALEALISRIFNIAPAGTVARDEGRPPD